jgi:hypothetical protein
MLKYTILQIQKQSLGLRARESHYVKSSWVRPNSNFWELNVVTPRLADCSVYGMIKHFGHN